MSNPPERPPLPTRRYTDKEVARIIKDASEIQQATTNAESSVGLSLAELEAVAREAGLDPTLVRRAAANLDSDVSGDERPSKFLGAPKSLVLERTINGELPADEYEVIALEIQRCLGGLGTASTFGRTLQWTSTPTGRRNSGLRTVQVTITPRNGFTTIRLEQPMERVAVAMFAVSMGAVGMGMMPLVSIGAGTLADATIGPQAAIGAAIAGGVAFIGGLYAIARYTYGRVVHGQSEKLQTLMTRLVDHVGATAKTTADS